jgi:chromosome segregation ATPase
MLNNILDYLSTDKEALSTFNKMYYNMLQSNTPQSQELFVNTFKNWISNEFNKKSVKDVQAMEANSNYLKETEQSWRMEINELHKVEEEKKLIQSKLEEIWFEAEKIDEYEKEGKKLTKKLSETKPYYDKLKNRLEELNTREDELTKTINEKRDAISSPLTKYWNENRAKPDLDSKYVNQAIHDFVLDRLNKNISKTVEDIQAGVEVYTMSDII